MDQGFDVGCFGLDAPGNALVHALADRGISVAVSLGHSPAAPLDAPSGLTLNPGIERLAASLNKPRILIIRMPAGPAAESGFAEAVSCLQPDDLLLDASDTWFRDSALRAQKAAEAGVSYLALGLSPNENSTVPALFVSGRPDAYARVAQTLASAAPLGHGQRALGYMGAGPAAHFTRMVHGAIDNAVCEIVREARAFLERGVGAEAGDLLRERRADPLCEYLQSPASEPCAPAHVELARWAARAGHDLEIPTLTLGAAAGARSWENRQAFAEPFCQPHGALRHDGPSLVAEALGAINVALIITYTEGLSLLATASEQYGLQIDLREAVRVWRAGASVRARLLEEIHAAFNLTPGLPNLLFDDDFSERVMELQEYLRHAVSQADEWDMPTPALAAALRYIDTFRDAWLPINLVQHDQFRFTPRRKPAYTPVPHVGHGNDDTSFTGQPFA